MKKFLSVIATLAMGLAIVGCGPSTGGNKRPDNEIIDYGDDYKTEITAEITFWHAMGQQNQAVIEEIIAAFNKEYPNIKVTQTNQGGYTELRDKISKTIASGDNPTIAQTYPDHVAAYMQGRAVRELDSYINHPRYGISQESIDDFIPAYFAEGRTYDVKGTLYSLPFNKSTEVMFFNKTYMKNHSIDGVTLYEKYNIGTKTVDGENVIWTDNPSPRLSWEDVVEICEYYVASAEYKALSAEEKNKHAGFAADSEANLFITLTQQFGGEYTSIEAPHYKFDNPQSKAAVAWFKENFDKGHFGTATKFGSDYSSDAFKAQQVLMTIGSSAGATYNYPGDPKDTFEVGIVPYPQFESATEDEYQVIQQGTNVTLFKCVDPMEELAGWLFMRFLTDYQAAMTWATKTGYFPIRESVRSSEEYEKYIAGYKEVYDSEKDEMVILYEPSFIAKTMKIGWEQRNYYYTSPAFPGSSDCRDEVEVLIQSVLYGGKSIDQAYADTLNELTK